MKLFDDILNGFGYITRTKAAEIVREQKKHLEQRSFEAVQVNRLSADFKAMSESINAAIRAGGTRLRELARQEYTNSVHARRYVDLHVINVVGEKGHTFQSDITILEEDPATNDVNEVSDDAKNAIIEKAWEDWGRAKHCSATRKDSWTAIQKMLATHKARDGEAFLRKVIDPESKYGLRLQVVPPELVPDTYTTQLPDGNVVICGIEFNVWRQPVAYYVLKDSLKRDALGFMQTTGEMDRVPASDMLHLFDPNFSNQSRGYTRLANVLILLTWMKKYNEAHVKNARFSAAKLGFIVDALPEETDDTVKKATTTTGNTQTQQPPAKKISGEELTFTDIGSKRLEKWDPQFPHSQHEMFNRVSQHDLATGLGVAYCSLSGDYSNSTWSSSRTELDVERHGWKNEQQLQIDSIDIPVFEWWLELALMKRAIPGFRYTDFQMLNHPYFFGPTWDYINPVDESNALRSDLEAQIISPFDVAAKKGKRLEDIYRDIRAAEKLRKKIGVPDPIYGKTGSNSTFLDAKPVNQNQNSNGVNANA